jgi:hypothetical protein
LFAWREELIRRCDVLPGKHVTTEASHYALEVLRRLKRGGNIETLELYLTVAENGFYF